MPHAIPGPLNGIVVLDLGQIYNGPYCSFLLARAGATVIKIEPPGGENLRRRGVVGGAMLPFAMLNSNKNFVTLEPEDRRRPRAVLRDGGAGRRAGGELRAGRHGPAGRRAGTKLQAENPRLIYAAGSGYGWSGPYRDYPAMDLTVQAMSGVMELDGLPGRPSDEGRAGAVRLLRRRPSLRRGDDRPSSSGSARGEGGWSKSRCWSRSTSR